MANNKLHGYQPKTSNEKDGNRLDLYNPYEFRKGMDYELTSIGCSRLAESTIEEREKATEKVLKNLENNGGYYTSLITYETLFRNTEGSKPSFTSWLKEQDDIKMKDVKNPYKTGKMKGPDYKNDKMKELKEAIRLQVKTALLLEKEKNGKPKNLITCCIQRKPCCPIKITWGKGEKTKGEIEKMLKESENREGGSESCSSKDLTNLKRKVDSSKEMNEKITDIMRSGMCCYCDGRFMPCDQCGRNDNPFDDLFEAKKNDDDDGDMDDAKMDKVAGKAAKGAKKKLSIFDQERETLEELIEYLKEKKDKELEKYKKSKKDKKAVESYKKAIELSEKDKKKLEKTAEKYEVVSKDYVEKDIPSTIKSLEKRLKAIDKDETEAISKLREEKKEIALTDMTREEQIRLLNIIKEKGISLREGTDSIKTYYEIAKASFLEGLTKGLNL